MKIIFIPSSENSGSIIEAIPAIIANTIISRK